MITPLSVLQFTCVNHRSPKRVKDRGFRNFQKHKDGTSKKEKKSKEIKNERETIKFPLCSVLRHTE